MIRFLLIFLCIHGATAAQAGCELKLSTAELLAQTDVVVVGRLANVKEWTVDKVDYGEGTIEVAEALFGIIPNNKKITLRWANRQYTTGRLEFEDTGKVKFIWLLWGASDGTFRVRHSGQKAPLDQKSHIVESIGKQEAEQDDRGDRDKPPN